MTQCSCCSQPLHLYRFQGRYAADCPTFCRSISTPVEPALADNWDDAARAWNQRVQWNEGGLRIRALKGAKSGGNPARSGVTLAGVWPFETVQTFSSGFEMPGCQKCGRKLEALKLMPGAGPTRYCVGCSNCEHEDWAHGASVEQALMERWQRSNRAGNEDDPKGARNTKRTEPPPRGGVELSPIALRTFADDLRAQASRWLARADDLYATADRWESFLNDEGALSDELKKVSALVQQGAHRR